MSSRTVRLAGLAALATLAKAMPLNAPLLDVYDYIVVGGGAAGLTVANRLTENPNITVLVLEAGYADTYEEKIQVPVFQSQAAHNGWDWCGQYNWCDYTVNQTYLNGQPRRIPQGYGLGGGTLVNAMLWNRGDKGDYDDWESLGNEGWGWDGMLPYFQKSETFHPESNPLKAQYFGIGEDTSIHGFKGPQSVAFPDWIYNSSSIFFAGLNSFNIPTVLDPSDGASKGGMFLPMGVNATNQTRADARRQRYDTAASRQNFYVSVRQQVTRLLFDGGCSINSSAPQRVVGVEYAPNPGVTPQTVSARKEVILAAGAIRTPQLLEMSGIGSSDIIQNLGLEQRLNLPGVGNNLQDHMLLTTLNFFTNQSYIYSNFLNNQTNNDAARAEYYANKTGPWTAGPPDGNAFLSLPQFSNRTDAIYNMAAGQSDDQFLAAGLDSTVVAGFSKMRPLLQDALKDTSRGAIEMLNDNSGGIQISNMRPLTRGNTHAITTNAFVHPALDFRYGSNPVDVEVLVDSLFFKHALLASPAMAILQPLEWSPASYANYTDLIAFINQNAATEYHPAGTAAMLPQSLGGVVDSNLLVYGTSNLRVVDASIQPIIPATHMESIVYAVAEKAADIIKAADSPAIAPPSPLDTSNCTAPAAYSAKFRNARRALPAGATPVTRPLAPTNEPVVEGFAMPFAYPVANPDFLVPIPKNITDTVASAGLPKGAGLLWTVTSGLSGVLKGLGDTIGGLGLRRA